MKTFENFLIEKRIPSNVQQVITDLEGDDAKILDYTVEEVHSIFVQYNSGDYEVISVVNGEVTRRNMKPAELRRYKTGH